MKSAFRAPSNIALVKYWGKYGVQLPSNPSISFTLDACATETTLELTETTGIRVALDGADTPSFVPKVAQFVERAATRHPWLKDYGLNVQTHNSFPHSSGIASSAFKARRLISRKSDALGRTSRSLHFARIL